MREQINSYLSGRASGIIDNFGAKEYNWNREFGNTIRGGIAPVLVTILTSAQLRKISGLPQPTASVPFSQVPHMFPEKEKG